MKPADIHYDLVVVGDAAIDILNDKKPPLRRPGGIFYSSLAAAAFGLKVGVVSNNGDKKNEFIQSINKFGVDTQGIQPNLDCCVEFQLSNINEVYPQVLAKKLLKSRRTCKTSSRFFLTKAVLLYPALDYEFLYNFAKNVKKHGGLVFLDLQHDLLSLDHLENLLRITDVVFASRSELLYFLEVNNDMMAVDKLRKYGAEKVVIKYGIGGSSVYLNNDNILRIPSYLANFKCTIGAGDVYNSVFILNLLKQNDYRIAGEKAAITASVFSECLDYPSYFLKIKQINFTKEKHNRVSVIAHPEELTKIKIYLAGHFLSQPMRNWVDTISHIFESRGFSVFNPYRDAGIIAINSPNIERIRCFNDDITALSSSTLVVALLDGASQGGTSWEMGYAYSKGIPIIGLLTDDHINISNMIYSSCLSICSDLPQMINEVFQFIATRN
ncbi:MAG: PfkB family carbohydrate kinase [Chloroherpetonaceae bacterium]